MVAANLTDGRTAEVALTGDTPGLPVYNGDDSAVLHMVSDPETVIGTSLVRRALAADRITPSGPQELVRPDAAAGVIYRRGPYPGPAPTLTPTPVTRRPKPTPTATAAGRTACTGDCNEDGEVTVDERIQGVNIAFRNKSLNECPVFDSSHDGEVTINETIQGVNNALNGCS